MVWDNRGSSAWLLPYVERYLCIAVSKPGVGPADGPNRCFETLHIAGGEREGFPSRYRHCGACRYGLLPSYGNGRNVDLPEPSLFFNGRTPGRFAFSPIAPEILATHFGKPARRKPSL